MIINMKFIKFLIILLCTIIPTTLFSQGDCTDDHVVETTKIGIDNNPYLNEDESKLLNEKFKLLRGDFDFTGKKCFFLRGNSGSIVSEKNYFFLTHRGNFRCEQLIIFNEKESAQYGEYNVVIISASKRLITKQYAVKKIIKHLRKKKKKEKSEELTQSVGWGK